MTKYPGYYLIVSLVLLAALPPFLFAEFFKYTDESGQSVYVDDVSKIPSQYRDQVDSYTEDEDRLNPVERMALEAQKEREQALRQQQRDQSLDLNRRKAQQKKAQSPKTSNPLPTIPHHKGATNVVIANGQVAVPVQFRHNGKRVTASLLLDTGANTTLISKSVGDQLGLEGGKTVGIQVVGGAVIPGQHVALDEMAVGPHKKRHVTVIVLDKAGVGGHQGLLGMDFLMGIKFHVDYDRQRIVWSG
ncbi:MAG: aspartyl protease family protein [Desulfatibacillum sp.]|nr:aspartyl protease family protein [Desulfatibacillum sp.]